MKKCFALLLTLLLALGLTATAFAVEGETPTRPSITVDGQTYEDITEVPITKLYQLVNDGTVSPAETFRFSIAAGSTTSGAATSIPAPWTSPGTTPARPEWTTACGLRWRTPPSSGGTAGTASW